MFHQSPKDMLGDHVAAVGPSSQSDQPAIAWILQVLRRNLRLIIAAVVVAVLGANLGDHGAQSSRFRRSAGWGPVCVRFQNVAAFGEESPSAVP